MNPALLKACVALVPVSLLIIGSVVMFKRSREWCSLLQLVGAGFLVVVVLVHLCEATHLFAWMNWGAEQSAGHYLDLSSAIAGFVLFPTGYLVCAIKVPRR
jgi:hypothetical protein